MRRLGFHLQQHMGWQKCPALSNRNGVGNSDRINKDLSHWEFKGSDMVDDGNNEDTGWCNLVKSDSNLRERMEEHNLDLKLRERMEEHSLSCKRKSSIKSKIVFQQPNNNCRSGLKYQMPLGDSGHCCNACPKTPGGARAQLLQNNTWDKHYHQGWLSPSYHSASISIQLFSHLGFFRLSPIFP